MAGRKPLDGIKQRAVLEGFLPGRNAAAPYPAVIFSPVLANAGSQRQGK
jgi:hypothetical protein